MIKKQLSKLHTKIKTLDMLPVFSVVFLGMLGVGIVIPVLAILLLGNAFFPASYTEQTKNIIFGLMIAVYSLAQFFGAPILGALSDRIGRKKALLISLIGTLIGYVLFTIGILTHNIVILFISRIIDGFTAGNISVATSAISDISDPKSKAKNFGLIGMAFGLGFIIGPYIGGKLSDPSVISWFNFSTPFIFASLLSIVNIILLQIMFKETLKTKSHTKISLMTGFKNINKAMHMPNLRTIFLVIFVSTLAFNFFTQFFQVYLIDKFNYNQSNIGDFFAYMGLFIVITQGFIIRPVSKLFSSEKVIRFTLFSLAVFITLLLLPSKVMYIYFIVPFIAMSNGLFMPNMTTVLSNMTDKTSQGEIMGINQSVQSLAQIIPPIIAGVLITINVNLPIIIAGILMLISGILYMVLFNKKDNHKFSEV